jgi:hypothetical protein
MKIGICKLCRKKKELIRKSHIIPNFMYKGLFDDNHTVMVFNQKKLDTFKTMPTGFYNKYFLCENCDRNIIGRLETYASVVLYGGNLRDNLKFETRISQSGIKSIYVTKLDYKLFKLFLLSILWRASISKLQFFSNVNLGKHENIIRRMILNGDPKNEKDYLTSIVMLNADNIIHKSILAPRKINDAGNLFYVFFINSIVYYYNIELINTQPLFTKGLLKQTNEMEVAILEGVYANTHFDSIMGKQK